ncbi:tetratricopeptide repeat protein [Aureispira anguillae]|uniref:Tetratricopeptide repeat protein n=1 Tax=Aureispira anguillae TaxID=2864201 RepID=A0A915YDF5_9BACT|nr:hypothetical protein [Aureispira anguillae]BDS11063.1 hypothetical protein AsAng_0017740 [Aureispira anguillae]
MKELKDKIHEQITQLCREGDLIAENEFFIEAINKYEKALKLIPFPQNEWEATTWVLTAIADALFLDGQFEKSLLKFTETLECPNAFGNSFIHLRLGQCSYETGNFNRAANELVRAYALEGKKIFKGEHPKYFKFLKSRIDTKEYRHQGRNVKYELFLKNYYIGYTYFERADPPMGCVFGKIEDSLLSYQWLKKYCYENQIELTADYEDEKLISTRAIPDLKVYNKEMIEIKGIGNQICGMDSEAFEIHVEGVPYPSYEEEFSHHVKEYNNSFKNQ